jgi:hypothetical protein
LNIDAITLALRSIGVLKWWKMKKQFGGAVFCFFVIDLVFDFLHKA